MQVLTDDGLGLSGRRARQTQRPGPGVARLSTASRFSVAPVDVEAAGRPLLADLATSDAPPGKIQRAAQTLSGAAKLGLLAALAVQNSLLTLLSRRSRAHVPKEDDAFASGTVVLLVEVLKLGLSLALLLRSSPRPQAVPKVLLRALCAEPVEMLRLALPGLLYTLQNTVVLMAAERLTAPLMSLVSQVKVLTTAVFSVAMLRRRLHRAQWLALALLAVGVGLVNVSQNRQQGDKGSAGGAATPTATLAGDGGSQRLLEGLLLVLLACTLSGFSGVYTELLLKKSRASIWLKNVQLASISLFTSSAVLYLREGDLLRKHGFFHGYSAVVLALVVVQAGGGLLIATIMKHLDNILKAYATSAAILLTCVVSTLVSHFQPTPLFLLGAALVVASIFLYNDQSCYARLAGWNSRGFKRGS